MPARGIESYLVAVGLAQWDGMHAVKKVLKFALLGELSWHLSIVECHKCIS